MAARMAKFPVARDLSDEEREDMALLFEFETCSGCDGDLEDHLIVRDMFGLPAAACLSPDEVP